MLDFGGHLGFFGLKSTCSHYRASNFLGNTSKPTKITKYHHYNILKPITTLIVLYTSVFTVTAENTNQKSDILSEKMDISKFESDPEENCV